MEEVAAQLEQEKEPDAKTQCRSRNRSRIVSFFMLTTRQSPRLSETLAAVRHYQVQAVCAVGMGRTGTQTDAVRKKNCIPGECPLFTIQGNFDVNKLHGMYRMMMELMIRTEGKALAGKKDRTAEEDDMLDMMFRGGERVRRENLMEVLEWYHLQEHI